MIKRIRMLFIQGIIVFLMMFYIPLNSEATTKSITTADVSQSIDSKKAIKKNTIKETGVKDFKNDTQAALKWSNENFPKIPDYLKSNEESELINGVNKDLRTKYMNLAQLYQPQENIKLLDNTFATETLEGMTLYANFTAEDFQINNDYFLNNTDKVFEKMLKDNEFGIDHGYFLGDLTQSALDFSKKETIQIKLTIPKGTTVTRIGTISDTKYLLERNQTLKYLEKTLKKDKNNHPYVEISAELSSSDTIEEERDWVENSINDLLSERFDIDEGANGSDFLELDPVGLNAGYLLIQAENVALKAFNNLKSSEILSENMFDKEQVAFTNGGIVNTREFEEYINGATLEEQIKKFNENYSTDTLGITIPQENGKAFTALTFAQLSDKDNIPTVSVTEELAGTLLHEFFHYFIHTTDYFRDRALFEGDIESDDDEDGRDDEDDNDDKKSKFRFLIKATKGEETAPLVDLLKTSYAEKNWEEFICEAFMAKLYPNQEIKKRFSETIFVTNRILDCLYDFVPPTVPENLKALKITGLNTKLTFKHASDKIGVEKYNIYQNGELVQSILLDKDDHGISYPNPEEKLKDIELLMVNLKPLTEYEFQVTAVDEALNESEKSTVLKIKTTDKIEDQTTLELQDVELYTGQKFNPDTPFKKVIDKDGHELSAVDITGYFIDEILTKNIDTSQPGVHKVYIGYQNANNEWQYSEDATVKVNEDQTSLELQNIELHIGQKFDPNALLKNVTDKDGNKLSAEDIDGYFIDDIQTKNLDTSQSSVHKVYIGYQNANNEWQYSEDATITIK